VECLYYDAFAMLSPMRHNSHSVGAININDMLAYYTAFGSVDDASTFITILHSIDREFINDHSNPDSKNRR